MACAWRLFYSVGKTNRMPCLHGECCSTKSAWCGLPVDRPELLPSTSFTSMNARFPVKLTNCPVRELEIACRLRAESTYGEHNLRGAS